MGVPRGVRLIRGVTSASADLVEERERVDPVEDAAEPGGRHVERSGEVPWVPFEMVMGRAGVARRTDVPDHRARADVSQVAEAHHVSVTDVALVADDGYVMPGEPIVAVRDGEPCEGGADRPTGRGMDVVPRVWVVTTVVRGSP